MSSQQLSSLLHSGAGLVEVIIVVFYVAFIPSIISTDSVVVKTIVQPRIEIADNSKKTCGDRNQGNGTFACPV